VLGERWAAAWRVKPSALRAFGMQSQHRLHPCGPNCTCSWPFGRSLRRRLLPTSVEELHAQRAQDSMESSTARALGWL
jgi:hypothetical protein